MPNESRVQKIRALVETVTARRKQVNLATLDRVDVFVDPDNNVKLMANRDMDDEQFIICSPTDDDQTVERKVGALFDGHGKPTWLTVSAVVSMPPDS